MPGPVGGPGRASLPVIGTLARAHRPAFEARRRHHPARPVAPSKPPMPWAEANGGTVATSRSSGRPGSPRRPDLSFPPLFPMEGLGRKDGGWTGRRARVGAVEGSDGSGTDAAPTATPPSRPRGPTAKAPTAITPRPLRRLVLGPVGSKRRRSAWPLRHPPPDKTAAVRLAVPSETRPGERRVAVVPEVARRLIDAGWEVAIQSGAGAGAFFDDDAYRAAGAHVAPDAAATLGGAVLVLAVNAPDAAQAAQLPEGVTLLSFCSARRSHRGPRRPGRQTGHRLQLRPSAPDQPGPGHGRPVLAGHGGRATGRHSGRRAPGPLLPDVHDRGRHRPAGQGAGDGGRGGRAAGHRHGPPARCAGAGLRRAGGGQGGGREPRGHLRRPRRERRRGRRLRPRADRRRAGPPAGRPRRRGGRLRRGHHHGGGAGPAGPRAGDDRRDGRA